MDGSERRDVVAPMKQAMNQETPDIFRYEPEDIEQRDESVETADLERKLERNKDAVARIDQEFESLRASGL